MLMLFLECEHLNGSKVIIQAKLIQSSDEAIYSMPITWVPMHVDELNIILLSFQFIFSHADFTPPSEGMSAGAVVAIVAAVALAIILLLGILWWRGCLRRKETMDEGTLKLTIVNKLQLFVAIFMLSKLVDVCMFAGPAILKFSLYQLQLYELFFFCKILFKHEIVEHFIL